MFDTRKVYTIIRKEWAEVYKNRMVIFSILFMPLLFTAIPLFFLYSTRGIGAEEAVAELPAQYARYCDPGLSSGECFQVFMVSQFILLYMMIPLIIPVNIAAYSIVGEKTTRSLEPLLATPITTAELLSGKNLAAVIPAILATWISFGLFAGGAALMVANLRILTSLLNGMWLLAIFLIGPLLAVLSVNFSLMISSRVNDPRVAEQLSAVVVVPVLAIFIGQLSGFLFLDNTLILWMAAGLLLLDAGLIYLSVRLFQRETILTRWK